MIENAGLELLIEVVLDTLFCALVLISIFIAIGEYFGKKDDTND